MCFFGCFANIPNASDLRFTNCFREFNNTLWVYVDKDVNVKGEVIDGDYTLKVDMKLKKGWNVAYHNDGPLTIMYADTHTYTTQKPSENGIWVGFF